ncbi:type II toxin-antitoxin system RelE/ParE family toxin [Polynucleobacter antarcticus]|uniref:Addiction module toxin RelE n=1 Tax=Polynucleobacter antarcticus TaxID=1743162 RepID=A0A6M9PN91_9BURK|nr:type II toxin-antitoxin system RelE/ParE family toxin [Polynucleobacter antarcticus]QKM61861.1 addiction module toxin RelE [Polynucleobacter antarcticus]
MRLLVTPTFVRVTKKLHSSQKVDLEIALRAIEAQPELGSAKTGDLMGIRVYKFKLTGQLCLLAYRILDESSLKLLTFGPHENFYRDLKRFD